MMTLQEISDRLELEKLTHDYALAIDKREIDDLDDIFTPDAEIDYTVYGGPKGRWPEVRAYLKERLPMFGPSHHMVANHQFTIEGDRATGRVMCLNPMEAPTGEGKFQTFFLGLWYIDNYVRTPQGWRIASRSEEGCWTHNVPEGLIP